LAGQRPYLAVNPEFKIIDPYWTSGSRRYLDQPLPQPRHGKDALLNELPQVLDTEVIGSFQDQYDRELLRNLAGVHCQVRQIAGVGTLDHLLGAVSRFRSRRVKGQHIHMTI
jgi:hypothetical protein